MAERDVQTREWRLLTMGIAARTARALARASAGPGVAPPAVLDAGAWSERALEEFRPAPGDAIVVGTGGNGELAERGRAFRARHPEVPSLVLSREAAAEEVRALLRAGHQEVFRGVAGFRPALDRARAKLRRKHLDLCVLNAPAALARERSEITLIDAAGRVETLPEADKTATAAVIVERALALAAGRRPQTGVGSE